MEEDLSNHTPLRVLDVNEPDDLLEESKRPRTKNYSIGPTVHLSLGDSSSEEDWRKDHHNRLGGGATGSGGNKKYHEEQKGDEEGDLGYESFIRPM